MADSGTVTVRLRKEALDRLNRLASDTKRSKSFLAAEAIEGFLDQNAWQIEETRKAALKADAGGPFVAHEEVTAWLESWGSNEEQPPPKATIKR
jgi:RHH-type transcriptional regulator, rel operon repressor / antitoxin RelB